MDRIVETVEDEAQPRSSHTKGNRYHNNNGMAHHSLVDEEPMDYESVGSNTTGRRTAVLQLDKEYENDPYLDDYQHRNQHNHNNNNHAHSPDGGESDDEGDFIKRLYDTTVDGPCRGVLPVCQLTMEQQLDLFTHCRQPLNFMSFFREHPGVAGGEVNVEVLPMGMYVVPTFCEYCGAESTALCDAAHCQRPALYFQKKRPPFGKLNATVWDPVSEHAIPKKQGAVMASPPELKHKMSWVSGLFGKNE